MSVAIARSRVEAPAEAPRSARVIAGHTMRRAVRGALIWGVVFGLWVLATIKAFTSGYPTLHDRQQLAQSLQAFSMLLGLPHHAETVTGFTAWRVLVASVTIGAIWGLLRGEEDAGRWELLLAGPTTKRAATLQTLLGLGGALGVMYAVTAGLVLVAGRLPGDHFAIGSCLLFALAMVAGAGMFGAIGALTSQLCATRSLAAIVAATILGGAYVLRMLADSAMSLGWLRWLSPIGWLEELRPLQDAQLLALVPIIGLTLVCGGLAVRLAGRRDLEASVLPARDVAVSATRWLVGPTSLALRVSGATGLAWLGGVGLMSVIYGSLARSATNLLSSSPAFTAVLGRLGARKAADSYLGIVFLLMAVLISALAASQLASIRDEEATGRLDNLLVRPVRRMGWLAGRLGLAAALVVLAGLTAGLCAWVGAASQHTGVRLPTLLAAGLNATVPGLFVLGIGTLVFGLRPRWSAVAVYSIVAWSFLVDMLGAVIKNADWLRDSSLFSHLALAPAATPDWGTASIIVLLGLVAAGVGILCFDHRDVEYT